MSNDFETYFHISVSGQLECANFSIGPDCSTLFCRYDVVHGPDWEVISGLKSGVTQCASVESDYRRMIFNMPIEFSLKSTNPYGWPQIVFSLYGTNIWGVETSRGYARLHCPFSGSNKTMKAPIFIPKYTTFWSALMSWITDINPEMKDPKSLADGSKHKGLYSEAYGEIVANLQVMSRGCGKMSLDWGQFSD